jgi:hypothetical protein
VKLTRPTGVSGSGAVLTLQVRGVAPGPHALAVESLSLTTAAGVERPASTVPNRVVVNP